MPPKFFVIVCFDVKSEKYIFIEDPYIGGIDSVVNS